MKYLLALLLVAVFQTSMAQESKKLEPRGVYQEIDIARHNAALDILSGADETSRKMMADSIASHPNDFIPPVLYAVSKELFDQNRKDEASYWFYVAQLRARYDANLCMEKSAKQAVSVLNNSYGPAINTYALQDLGKLEQIVEKVVAFVRENEENYDHRWLNLHGMDAVLTSMGEESNQKELTQPREKWASIKKETVDEYYAGFIEYVKKK